MGCTFYRNAILRFLLINTIQECVPEGDAPGHCPWEEGAYFDDTPGEVIQRAKVEDRPGNTCSIGSHPLYNNPLALSTEMDSSNRKSTHFSHREALVFQCDVSPNSDSYQRSIRVPVQAMEPDVVDMMHKLQDLRLFYSEPSSRDSGIFIVSGDKAYDYDHVSNENQSKLQSVSGPPSTIAERRGYRAPPPIDIVQGYDIESDEPYSTIPSSFLGTSAEHKPRYSFPMDMLNEPAPDVEEMINELRSRCDAIRAALPASPRLQEEGLIDLEFDNSSSDEPQDTTSEETPSSSSLSTIDEWAFADGFEISSYHAGFKSGTSSSIHHRVSLGDPPKGPLPPLPGHELQQEQSSRHSIKSILKPSRPRKRVRFAIPNDSNYQLPSKPFNNSTSVALESRLPRPQRASASVRIHSTTASRYTSVRATPVISSRRHSFAAPSTSRKPCSSLPSSTVSPHQSSRISLSHVCYQPGDRSSSDSEPHPHSWQKIRSSMSRTQHMSLEPAGPRSSTGHVDPRAALTGIKRVPIPNARTGALTRDAELCGMGICQVNGESSYSSLYATANEYSSRRFTLESVRGVSVTPTKSRITQPLRTMFSAIPKPKRLAKRKTCQE